MHIYCRFLALFKGFGLVACQAWSFWDFCG